MERLPITVGTDRTDGAVSLALGLAAVLAVCLFVGSVMQVSANSERIAAALQGQPALSPALLAGPATNAARQTTSVPSLLPSIDELLQSVDTSAAAPRPPQG
jgi:hypothetical protein